MLSISSARRLAERIYADEAGEGSSADDAIEAGKRIYQKLDRAMSPVVGETGFKAMVGRTVQRCRSAHPCLEGAVGLDAVAFLEVLAVRSKATEPATIRRTSMALLAEFLILLSTFIGSEMAFRLLLFSWPESIADAIEAVEKT